MSALLLATVPTAAHPIWFNASVTYSDSQPAGGADSIANWTGAAFDADNIGGSGINADGGANNGTANDAYTYVANNQPRQGQTFTTGPNPDGYQLTAVTARMAGYTNNNAAGSNRTFWDLNAHNGPVLVEVGKVTGTDVQTLSKQLFIMGGTGNPGAGGSADGAGDYVTFHLPFTTCLEPNTTYCFDFSVGNGSSNYFEWLGTQNDAYTDGTAYNREWWGGPIIPLTGERVFQVELTALDAPAPSFAHPGTLHTQADLARMKAKIDTGQEPWQSGYNMLLSSPYNNLGWPAYNVDYIVRGGTGNNYTRSQQDAQLIYTQALIWHLTGNTAYADRAVEIANVWSDLIGIQGDTNASLAAGICGYLFAVAGDLLSTYPGWAEAEKQAYKDMMMRVFYPANLDLLWRHHDTFWRTGGNTHYRLNWDTANMASMAAIGILCDNRAVYEQAVDYFKYGPGNGRVERAGWYLHPGGLGQGEEAGRDQGHNLGGWHAMALLCQMAWNQGDDLFAYDNNRVLRVFEYNAKYNLGHDVPYTAHRNCDLNYTEGAVSGYGRGLGGYYQYELIYNHYANEKGIAAPWSKLAADATRPEPWPNTGIHPSQVDWFGLGTLTYSRESAATDQPPAGLRAHWSKHQITLDWWGSARATGYLVKRAVSAGGPYTQIGTVSGPDLNFTDTHVDNGTSYYYIVTAVTPSGELDSDPLRVAQELVTRYTFEGNVNDVAGNKNAELHGGSTGLPGYTTGFGGGQAMNLDGVDDYVQMPVGIGNHQDITIAAWVYWNGGGNWQRVFDFGSDMEKSMFLTPSNGGVMRFSITTTRGAEGSVNLDAPVMPTGRWTHVAVSLNSDTGTLYVNGKPAASELIDQVDPLFGQPYCYIGKSMWNADPLLNGRVDDFRIYNYGLSGDEVWDMWGQSANHAPVFDSDPIDEQVHEDMAITGTLAIYAADADGNPMTFTKVTGPDWLSVAANGALSGTPGNDRVGENVFVVRATDSGGATDDATLRVTVVNTNDAPSWTQPAYTLDEAAADQPYNGTVTALADDIDPDETLTFSKISGPDWLSVTAGGTLSGTPTASDVGPNLFTLRVTDAAGAYDETAVEIVVYGLPLKAYYKFEGTAQDSTGSYHAAATGAPAYVDGPIGRAIDLDGTDDYVTLPAGIADTQDVTIAGWFKWDGGSQWQRAFDFGSNTTYYMFLTPRSGSNTLRFAISNDSFNNEQQLNAPQMPTGQWQHIAVVLEGDTGRLYVDGVLADTHPAMTLNPASLNASANYLGKSQFPDSLFNGQIDDFRIYHLTLSPQAVAELAKGYTDLETLFSLACWWLRQTDSCRPEASCLTMDFNGDGAINLRDLAQLAHQWF